MTTISHNSSNSTPIQRLTVMAGETFCNMLNKLNALKCNTILPYFSKFHQDILLGSHCSLCERIDVSDRP